jgi:hypothetical protein
MADYCLLENRRKVGAAVGRHRAHIDAIDSLTGNGRLKGDLIIL